MVISYEIEGDFVTLVGSGSVTRSDIEAALSSIVATPEFRIGSRLLMLDQQSDYVPDTGNITETATLLSRRRGQFERMAVVVSQAVKYGVGRMLEAYTEAEGLAFRVFLDENEARRWLTTG